MDNLNLFTIGYANKVIEEFINLLEKYNINCIVDVRSTPYSAQFPDYNANVIKHTLKSYNITYLDFSEEFGARRLDDRDYSSIKLFDDTTVDVVDFKKVWDNETFLRGVDRIKIGLKKGYNICFLCGEKYPYDCHRGIMVSEYFFRKGYNITHIVNDDIDIKHDVLYELEEVKKYFHKCKSVFMKNHEKDVLYSYDLFEMTTRETADYIKFWFNFFNEITPDKLMFLLNLKIGYKKGGEENG